MRGATRAADVTNILNRKFLEFVRCLKEDLKEYREISFVKLFFMLSRKIALCNNSDPLVGKNQIESNMR